MLNNISFQEEVVTEDLYDECEPLFLKHKEEINNLNSTLSVEPWEYIRAYRLGAFVFFTIRKNNKVIGYSGYQTYKHSYDGKKTADQHLLYLIPEYRKGLLGLNLIKFCEEKLKEKEVIHVLQHTSKIKDLGKLFQRLGYTECEVTYSKEL